MLNFIKENLLLFIIIFLIIVAPSFILGAFSIFAYIILAIILFIAIGSIILRWRLRKFFKANREFSQRGYGSGEEYNDPDGTIKVKVFRSGRSDESGSSSVDKKVSSEVGDYVDFEEIKEK